MPKKQPQKRRSGVERVDEEHDARFELRPQPFDAVVEAVRNDLLLRSRLGLDKYTIGIDRSNLDLRGWLQHTYEEVLDTANYLKRAIIELDAKGDSK